MTTATAEQIDRVVINSLGECYHHITKDGEQESIPLGSGGIAVTDVACKVLTAEQFEIWQDHDTDHPDFTGLDAFVSGAITWQFKQDAFVDMPPPVFDFYVRTSKALDLNDGRMRVWGERDGMHADAEEHIWLVTEFRHFTDDRPGAVRFWKELELLATGGYAMRTFDEGSELEKSWKDGVNGYVSDGPTTDANAIYGPNHGRPYRQVEFYKDITSLTRERHWFGKFIEERRLMARRTDAVWPMAGVGVV